MNRGLGTGHSAFEWLADLVKRHWLTFILVSTVLTRIPFLYTGYGADADAWLVAKSASTLWRTGIYHESRLPGYPLHEIVSAPLVGLGGALLSNSATLLATLIAVGVWSRILGRVGRHPRLLAAAFAFAPVVWQQSATTLDYMWSLLFILISVDAVLGQRPLFAGIALGLATGFRPTGLVAVVPLACLWYLRNSDKRQVYILIASALSVSFVCFLPLVYEHGFTGWFVATAREMSDVLFPTFGERCAGFLYRTIYFVGPVTVLFSVYAFWRGKSVLMVSLREWDPLVVASTAGVLAFLAIFFWLPLDRAYLLPILPFLLLLLDTISSRTLMTAIVVCLFLSALITLDVVDAKDRHSIRPNIRPGMVIQELQLRGLHLPGPG